MATNEVFMNVPEVEKFVKQFQTFGDVLDKVANVLNVISMSLKATSWLSFGATAAMAAIVNSVIPSIQNMAKLMRTISDDIVGAIKAYRDGDLSGSQRFAG